MTDGERNQVVNTYRVKYETRQRGAIGVFTWSKPVEVRARDEESARELVRSLFNVRALETRGCKVEVVAGNTAEEYVKRNK